MAIPAGAVSPTCSTISSTSSYVTVKSGSQFSDDEVVYSIEDSASEDASNIASDDDFVVLSRPISPRPAPRGESPDQDRVSTPDLEGLTDGIQALSVTQPSKAKATVELEPASDTGSSAGSAATDSPPSTPSTKVLDSLNDPMQRPGAVDEASQEGSQELSRFRQEWLAEIDARRALSVSTTSPTNPPKSSIPPQPAQHTVATAPSKKTKKKTRSAKRKEKERKKVATATTKQKSSKQDTSQGSTYQEAVQYISNFIANPEAKENSACKLALLQALIVELGFAASSLPASLTAARNFLKCRVFLNIREYLAVRGQGLEALKKIMHPSRKSLVKSIRKKKNTAPLKWVKESGLQVLLVQAYH